MLALGCAGLVVVSYFCYKALGSDLLPEMDEGGFVLDYLMPAGSSLKDTNDVLLGVEKMLSATPEVESTSRRTGLQLGLQAVTEANTGDFLIKLKEKRDKGSDEIISDLRDKIGKAYPQLDIEFVQVLQDQIGDLTSSPEPIEIKLFSPDPALLAKWGPKVADAVKKVQGVADLKDGIENTISGPAVIMKIDPTVAARSGFTTKEVELDASAILQGEPSDAPAIVNDRSYTIRVRFPNNVRTNLDQIRNTMISSSTGKPATLGALAGYFRRSRADRNLARGFAKLLYRRDGAVRRSESRKGHGGGAGCGRQAGNSADGARGLRRHLRGAAEIVPRFAGGARGGCHPGVYRAAV